MTKPTEPVYASLDVIAELHDTMMHLNDKTDEILAVLIDKTDRMIAVEGLRRERDQLLFRILARLVERSAPEMTFALHELKLRAENDRPPATARATSRK